MGVRMTTVADAIDLDALRLRGEFLAMPGLTVNVTQVARLLGIRAEHAAAILAELEREQLLTHTANGSYRRAAPTLS